eukprot:sb/3461678/
MSLEELLKTSRCVKIPKTKRGYGFHIKGLSSKNAQFAPSVEAPCSQFMFGVDKDSEAQKAGVLGNDFIYKVNGKDVTIASHKEVVEMIRKSGNPLTLQLIQVSSQPVAPPPAVPKRNPTTKLQGPVRAPMINRSQSLANGTSPRKEEQIYANVNKVKQQQQAIRLRSHTTTDLLRDVHPRTGLTPRQQQRTDNSRSTTNLTKGLSQTELAGLRQNLRPARSQTSDSGTYMPSSTPDNKTSPKQPGGYTAQNYTPSPRGSVVVARRRVSVVHEQDEEVITKPPPVKQHSSRTMSLGRKGRSSSGDYKGSIERRRGSRTPATTPSAGDDMSQRSLARSIMGKEWGSTSSLVNMNDPNHRIMMMMDCSSSSVESSTYTTVDTDDLETPSSSPTRAHQDEDPLQRSGEPIYTKVIKQPPPLPRRTSSLSLTRPPSKQELDIKPQEPPKVTQEHTAVLKQPEAIIVKSTTPTKRTLKSLAIAVQASVTINPKTPSPETPVVVQQSTNLLHFNQQPPSSNYGQLSSLSFSSEPNVSIAPEHTPRAATSVGHIPSHSRDNSGNKSRDSSLNKTPSVNSVTSHVSVSSNVQPIGPKSNSTSDIPAAPQSLGSLIAQSPVRASSSNQINFRPHPSRPQTPPLPPPPPDFNTPPRSTSLSQLYGVTKPPRTASPSRVPLKTSSLNSIPGGGEPTDTTPLTRKVTVPFGLDSMVPEEHMPTPKPKPRDEAPAVLCSTPYETLERKKGGKLSVLDRAKSYGAVGIGGPVVTMGDLEGRKKEVVPSGDVRKDQGPVGSTAAEKPVGDQKEPVPKEEKRDERENVPEKDEKKDDDRGRSRRKSERHKDKDRSKERSSKKSKDKSKSERSKDKTKDRSRSRDRKRDKSKDRKRDRSRDRKRDKSKERSKDSSKDRSKDRTKSSRKSSKDRSRKSFSRIKEEGKEEKTWICANCDTQNTATEICVTCGKIVGPADYKVDLHLVSW